MTPDALSTIPDGASVADALKVLQKKGFAHEGIPVLADAMPEREAVWWAAQSCKQAGDSLPPADRAAAKAAAAWVTSPSPETAAAASAAAQEAGFSGPGAFAAQAAALAEDPPVLAAGDPLGMSLAKQTAAGSVRLAALSEAELLPAAVAPEVAGAVAAVSAAAVTIAAVASKTDSESPPETSTEGDPPPPGDPSPPADAPPPEDVPVSKKQRKQASKASVPYLKMGQDIAAGKNHW
ncbi:MAG: hypothetical protein Q9O74_06685 [Planctomycetota bacterium]|nr:hypothetical protein [Planctomycetota bacterium]